MKVCIMQPTYLSWMGYFGMMDMSSIFVFCDDVQFERRSWQQRNRIKMLTGRLLWLSVPVFQNREAEIKDVKICNATDWRHIHWGSIYHAYHKAPYFKDYQETIESIYQKNWENLCDMNIYIINTLALLLGIKIPETIRTSAMAGITDRKTNRVLNILQKLGADEYISAPGSRCYLEKSKFNDAGIRLYWYEYNHPAYSQIYGNFIPYLSVIDLLFNTGKEAINYIRQGEEKALRMEKFIEDG